MPEETEFATVERDETKFAALTTNIQFSALAAHLARPRVVLDLRALLARRVITPGANCDRRVVKQWILNGWNTEILLRTNSSLLKDGALRHSLHWAFPQAYYSVFALTLAYFKTVGITEDGHTPAIRRFGSEAFQRRYPDVLRVLADGYPPTLVGFTAAKPPASFAFDESNPDMVLSRLGQFLCTTREFDLADKKSDLKLKTKSGAPRKSFRPEHWAQASSKVGYTSILGLLYRKRIKANYRDIDTFLHPDLEVERVYTDLINIVSAINLVHETLVARALGVEVLKSLLTSLPGQIRSGPPVRMSVVESLAV